MNENVLIVHRFINPDTICSLQIFEDESHPNIHSRGKGGRGKEGLSLFGKLTQSEHSRQSITPIRYSKFHQDPRRVCNAQAMVSQTVSESGSLAAKAYSCCLFFIIEKCAHSQCYLQKLNQDQKHSQGTWYSTARQG